jgi:hypothetical protein
VEEGDSGGPRAVCVEEPYAPIARYEGRRCLRLPSGRTFDHVSAKHNQVLCNEESTPTLNRYWTVIVIVKLIWSIDVFIVGLLVGTLLDSRLLDSRLLDSRLLDSRLLDSRLLDSRLLDSRLLDSRLFDSRLPDAAPAVLVRFVGTCYQLALVDGTE